MSSPTRGRADRRASLEEGVDPAEGLLRSSDTYYIWGHSSTPGEHRILTPPRPMGTGHEEPMDSGSHQCPCHLHGHPWRQSMYKEAWRAAGAGGQQLPSERIIGLTVCSGRVSLPGAGGEDHSERCVGYLEELAWPLSLEWPPPPVLSLKVCVSFPSHFAMQKPAATLSHPDS